MRRISSINTGSVALISLFHYFSYNVNVISGILGLPNLIAWCVFAERTEIPWNVHRKMTIFLATISGYIPLAATLFDIPLWNA